MRSRLTTVDNPHDPFDEFRAWFQWDAMSGYHTPSYLARVAQTSHDLSDADEELANEQAIDAIVRENVSGVYRKVQREIPDIPLTTQEIA